MKSLSPVRGFTLVELLVTVGVLVALTMMASGIYMGYVKTGEDAMVRNNLRALRGALQQFYLDNGRYPYYLQDPARHNVGILDDATSELTQGPYRPAGANPPRGVRYLNEIPLDPSTNAKDWIPLPQSVTPTGVVTSFASSNPLYSNL